MPLIELQQVFKQLNHQIILKKLNLTLLENDQVGIQMTQQASHVLFQLITGQLEPTSGQVITNATRVTPLLTNDGLYGQLTVQTYLQTFKQLADNRAPLMPQLQAFALADVRQRQLKQLSLDQQRRLALLRASLTQPQLLLLENPLINLSNAGIELYLQALKTVRAQGITVLTTSQYMADLLLLSTTIYRYRPHEGLEKTDLAPETNLDETENSAPAPTPVFKVTAKLADKTVFFSPAEIDYIESINGVSQLSVGADTFPSPLTMTELEQQLTNFGFFRCHRSYLVNLQRIAALISYSRNSYTLTLKNDAKLPLSRTKLTALRQLLNF